MLTGALISPQAPLPVQKAWLLPPLRFQADAPQFQVLSYGMMERGKKNGNRKEK